MRGWTTSPIDGPERPDIGNSCASFNKDSGQQPATGNGPTHAFVQVGRLQPPGLQDVIKFEAVRTPTQWLPR